MKRSKQQLMNTGYFEEATIATVKGSSANKLNVDVNVKEKPTGTFSIGGGYSSLDGIIGQGSVQQANFLGLGLKANLSGSIGANRRPIRLVLRILTFWIRSGRWAATSTVRRAITAITAVV